MAKATVIVFESKDPDDVQRMVNQFLRSQGTGAAVQTEAAELAPEHEVATRFAQFVKSTATAGRPAQLQTMTAWLQAGGELSLRKLWGAAGVKNQHDYAGVGGSLTKNMKKAGGPREWYTAYTDRSGEWIYKVSSELLQPLQNAFGV